MAEKKFYDAAGRLLRIHKTEDCVGTHCPFHNPSDHKMNKWPMIMRTDHGVPLIERICPCGIGHPDPDSLVWLNSQGHHGFEVHGCCSCHYT